MLEIRNVTKRYKSTLANNNLCFTIGDGQLGVLLGPNGAGKSTIIKSIAGLLRYDGEIFINGIPNKDMEAKRILGYVPEIPALYDTLTVEEHLEFIRRAYKYQGEDLSLDLLERFELADKRKKLGKDLSKGMQQKLSIVCALSHDPEVIIFDEPMVGLDPHAIKELKLIFNELRKKGKTILVSTHMIDTIEDNWDIVNIMMKGKIAASKTKDDNTDVKSIEALYFEITEGNNA